MLKLLISLVFDEQRNVIERGTLLNCLAQVPNLRTVESYSQNILEWAQNPDEWVGGGSLRVLVYQGLIENYPKLMRNALGLEKIDQEWHIIEDIELSQWAPHLIGRLYYDHPKEYADVVAQLFLRRDWHPSIQLLHWLYLTHAGTGKPPIPPIITDALIRRVCEYYSPAYGETEVFLVLGAVAPIVLIDQDWLAIASNWIADTLVALANAFGVMVIPTDQKTRCFTQLEKLAENSLYAVRRAAYRALANQSQEHLYQLCFSWSEVFYLGL